LRPAKSAGGPSEGGGDRKKIERAGPQFGTSPRKDGPFIKEGNQRKKNARGIEKEYSGPSWTEKKRAKEGTAQENDRTPVLKKPDRPHHGQKTEKRQRPAIKPNENR